MNYNLFKLKCECDTIYNPDENPSCPNCSKAYMFHKEFSFDVDKFLETVYSLNGKRDATIDLIFTVFDHLYDKFDIMNEIVGKVDVNNMDPSVMISFLCMTFKYIKQVPNHIGLCDRIENELRKIGPPEFSEERIHKLIDRYRETGNYWQRMSLYGAPEWLSGPKPKD